LGLRFCGGVFEKLLQPVLAEDAGLVGSRGGLVGGIFGGIFFLFRGFGWGRGFDVGLLVGLDLEGEVGTRGVELLDREFLGGALHVEGPDV